jgi:nucleoside kinase
MGPMGPARTAGERDLAVSGHVNVDRFLRVRRFPDPDRTAPVEGFREELGGTATNVALVAARLGVRTGLVSRIGDGFPAAFLRRLASAGIDLDGVERFRGRSTPTCYIVEDRHGRQRTLIDQGPMDDAVRSPIPRRWLARYAWLHLGTGSPERQLALADAARAAGVRLALDPAQEIFYRWGAVAFRRGLRSAEILFGNVAEIAQACRWAGVARPERLTDRVPLVVRTEGARGATAFSRNGRSHVRSERPARIRSFVGAGDAFRGGFYAAFFRGETMGDCLRGGTRSAVRWIEGRS